MECLPLLGSKLLCELCGGTSCSNESAVKCITVSLSKECQKSSFPSILWASLHIMDNYYIYRLTTLAHTRVKSLLEC